MIPINQKRHKFFDLGYVISQALICGSGFFHLENHEIQSINRVESSSEEVY